MLSPHCPFPAVAGCDGVGPALTSMALGDSSAISRARTLMAHYIGQRERNTLGRAVIPAAADRVAIPTGRDLLRCAVSLACVRTLWDG